MFILEYILFTFLGFIISVVMSVIIKRFKKDDTKPLDLTQSRIISIIVPMLDNVINKKYIEPNTQSLNYIRNRELKVFVFDNIAYWIKDNIVYCAELNNGSIDSSSARVVDTMDMDKVQLDKMLFIIDQLRKGDD